MDHRDLPGTQVPLDQQDPKESLDWLDILGHKGTKGTPGRKDPKETRDPLDSALCFCLVQVVLLVKKGSWDLLVPLVMLD